MLFCCSKNRLYSSLSYANKVSLVDIACHTTSLYLCWNIFLNRFLVKFSRGGGNSFYLFQENHGQSHMTISQLLGSTLRVLQTTPMPWKHPPSTSSGTISTFLNFFYKSKTWHWAMWWSFQLSMTEDSAIRIGLHSAEVLHFTHKIW
jgi:hypothetical protein